MTNPRGPQRGDEFDADLGAAETPPVPRSHEDESVAAPDDPELRRSFESLEPDELGRLSYVQEGTQLEQGAVYVDLNDLERGPFKALAGRRAGPGNRYVAKRDTDYELWNRLVGDREPEVERPHGSG